MSALLEGPGPRPLRSIERLWGIANLKPRELEQVCTGNDLLRALIIVLYASKAAGAVAAMEHPAPPTWKPNAPSSFYLPELKWLRNLGEAGFDIFDQCMLGAPSVKPTALLHANFPQVSDRIADMPNACRCDRSHQHIALIGRAEDGTFKTAPAKQYPGPMNHLLALSSVDFCKRRLLPGEPSWDDFTGTDLAAFYVPLDPFCVDQQLGLYGADFSTSSGLCNSARLVLVPPQFDEVGSASKTANASHARALQVVHSRSGAPILSQCGHLRSYASPTVYVPPAKPVRSDPGPRTVLDWLRAASSVGNSVQSPHHVVHASRSTSPPPPPSQRADMGPQPPSL